MDLPLQYFVYAQDAEQDPLQFGLENEPDGMAIDTQTGLLNWTPMVDQLGEHTFTIIVSDGRGGQAVQTITMEVVATAVNDPPLITSIPRQKIRVGDVYRYRVKAMDPNGDPLSFTLPAAPENMTIDEHGLVLWVPSVSVLGEHVVRVEVSDGRDGMAFQEYVIRVERTAENQSPSIVSVPVGPRGRGSFTATTCMPRTPTATH